MNKANKKKIGFKISMMLLVSVIFASGILAGAFMYATGKEVVMTPWMTMVSHTEYRYAEGGQIIARLVDFQGDPIVVTSCNATILYPDKTVFVSNAGMTNSGISGDHYYNFTTPTGPEGVYEYQATCFYGINKNASVTNSFHLSSSFNTISGNLTMISNQVANITTQNFTADFAIVNSKLDYLNVTVTQINSTVAGFSTVLDQINTTTTSTYTYLTTTLATDVDDILSNLGIINATVNRIETVSNQINTTTTQILENQQNEVHMDTFSG